MLIIDTLRHTLGNRTHAATVLGISIRTLRNKLREYGDEGIAVAAAMTGAEGAADGRAWPACRRVPQLRLALRQGDVLLAVGVLAILVVLILPLPAILLDLCLAISITLAVLILLTALFIERPLEFSAFPTVLLIATMLRLALNLASTRLILGQGHRGPDAAGHACTVEGGFVPILAISPAWEQAFAAAIVGQGDERQLAMRLPPLPGDLESEAFGINKHGVVVGASRARSAIGEVLGGHVETPVVWDQSGKLRRLELPAGYQEGSAQAINDRGQVAGFVYRIGSRHDRAVTWTRAGRPSLLRRLGGLRDSEAYAIDGSGVAAGASDGATLVATLWSPGPRRLHRVRGAVVTEAFGVSDDREAAGFATVAGGAVALRWDASGRPHRLPPLSGDGQAQAFAINEHGVVAGVSIGAGRSRGILWQPGRCGR